MLRILGQLEVSVLLLAEDWRVNYANAEACRMIQIDGEAVRGRSVWELFPVGTQLEREIQTAIGLHAKAWHSFFYEPSQLWIELRVLRIDTGIALLYRDVTAQRLEKETKASLTRRLEQVLEATTDGIAHLDRDFNFTYLNRRGQELVAPSGNVLGRNLWECYPDAAVEGSPFKKAYYAAMFEGVSSSFESYYAAPLNIWLSVQAIPAADGILVYFRDVTKEHDHEEVLQMQQTEAERQRSEIEAMYRAAPVGLALFDAIDFRYLRLNDRQAEFFGLRAEELLGTPVAATAPIEGLLELFHRVAAGESVRNHLFRGELSTLPGAERYWSVSYVPMYGKDGTVVAISTASMEITQQRRAETALIQSEKLAAVGRLSQTISHEINNWLESVTNLLFMVATDASLSGETREHVEAAQREVERISQIAVQSLSLGRQSVTKTGVNPNQMLHDVLRLYQGRLNTSSVKLELRLAADMQVLVCHENQVRQVLNNLIGNAVDAMPKGGRLLVRAGNATHAITRRPGIRITIADTGEGMSAATKKHIFEAFYTTKEAHGTGLGMWISADIVSQHDGQLRFRSSTHPGRSGTVFSMFLPLERRAVAA